MASKKKFPTYLKYINKREATVALAAFIIGIIGALTLANIFMNTGDKPRFDDSTALRSNSLVTATWLPSTVKNYKDTIEEQARRYDLNANFIAILMTIESGGYSKAESSAGARGLMQLTPIAEGDIRSKHLITPVAENSYDIFKPETNIEFGVAYMNWLRNQFVEAYPGISDGNLVYAIASAYNGGPGVGYSYLRGEGIAPNESAVYSRNAFTMFTEKDSTKSYAYDRWREADAESLNLVGQGEAEQKN